MVDEIGYLPYPGSMQTGSASALDQAPLLGGLIDAMGVDVMLAHGSLSMADTKRLVASALDVQAPKLVVDGHLLTNSDTQTKPKEFKENPANEDAPLSDVDHVHQSLKSAFLASLSSTSPHCCPVNLSH